MSDSRLGAPVELPWWMIPLGLPPLVTAVLGLVLGAPQWARIAAVLASVALLVALVAIATRVASRNIQSVWISAAYAVWVFVVILWAVALATSHTCNCA